VPAVKPSPPRPSIALSAKGSAFPRAARCSTSAVPGAHPPGPVLDNLTTRRPVPAVKPSPPRPSIA